MIFLKPLLLTLLFGITELLYFRLAKKYNIVDIPNHRSAHQTSTIRGIGILFPFALLVFFLLNNYQYDYFFIGLFLLSAISFVDDIRPLPNRYRIIIQFLSVALLLQELISNNLEISYFEISLSIVLGVGILNAYNFMDGINGITGAFSLLTILTLYYVNEYSNEYVSPEFLTISALSLCVFLFFNFRKKAIGFCGDVGSMSMAFIIIFCLGMLIFKSGEWKYILLLSIYGIDTIYTILYRLYLGQNIFKAHKLHFFQILTHQYHWSHLQVSILFVVAQLLVNIVLISFMNGYLVYLLLLIILLVVHFFRKKKNLGIF